MPMNEEEARKLDERLPELFRESIARAVEEACSSGQIVTFGRAGNVVERLPDGSTRIKKRLPPRVPIELGKTLEIQ
ncbi:MAG TPA: hypothetical protein V6D47_13575 [Oscillatoriaceae cyanobacterium]